MFVSSKKHIVKSYDKQIKSLRDIVIKAKLDSNKISKLTRDYLCDQKPTVLEDAKAILTLLKQRHAEIEKLATSIIALRQPMGIDLRLVISSIKLVSLFVAIGIWNVKAIARMEQCSEFITHDLNKAFLSILDICSEIIDSSVSLLISARINIEEDLAALKSLHLKDSVADKLYIMVFNSIKNTLLNDSTDGQTSIKLFDVISVAKNLEKMADTATELAAAVEYIIGGNIDLS